MLPATALFLSAVRSADIGQMEVLAQEDPTLIQSCDEHTGQTALCLAVASDCLPAARWLLDRGAKTDTEPSPLVLAFSMANAPLVDLLIANGATAGWQSQWSGGNWFQALCKQGMVPSVGMVFDRLLPVAEHSALYAEGFQAAVENGHVELLDLFRDRNATTWQLNRWSGNIPLPKTNNHLPVMERLLGWGAWTSQHELVSAFARLAGEKRDLELEFLQLFVDHGMKVNQPDGCLGPLHKACARGSLNLIEELHRRGARIDQKDDGGNTPLSWALMAKDDTPVVEWLLRRGADVHAISGYEENGRGIMHFAARSGSIPAMALLLEAGADINDRDRNGDTPLHYAAARQPHQDMQVLSWLVERGADPHAKNHKGDMPGEFPADEPVGRHMLDIAAQCQALRLAKLTDDRPLPRRGRRL